MPLTIDHKVRPSHYVYDVAMITQAMIAKARGFRIHASNMTDYNIAKSLGLRPIYLPLGTDTTIFKCRDKPDIFTVIYASWPA
ncbi:hypothetical protein [Vulcanisaeta distributa]|nr:hypothetical protein [Vulcanisaeta distributa]